MRRQECVLFVWYVVHRGLQDPRGFLAFPACLGLRELMECEDRRDRRVELEIGAHKVNEANVASEGRRASAEKKGSEGIKASKVFRNLAGLVIFLRDHSQLRTDPSHESTHA